MPKCTIDNRKKINKSLIISGNRKNMPLNKIPNFW